MSFWRTGWLALKHWAGPPRPAQTVTGPETWPRGLIYGASTPSGLPGDYISQVRAAYQQNAVAQRSVRIVAEGAGSAPLLADKPINALLQSTSHEAQDSSQLLATLASHLLLHGNAYVQIARDAEGKPERLYPLRPDRVTIESDAQGWPAAYLYRVGEAVTRFAAYDDDGAPHIVHLKTWHPDDDHYGLGCLGAAAEPVAIHNAASRWNRALLDNAARPSGALVYDPGEAGAVLSADQFDRLKAELESNYGGAGNAGRPLLLEGGLKWQGMSLSPADMDFVALKAAAARDIALAFGVPPMLLGLPGDNTYANYREANRALWRLTILPLLGTMLGGLGGALRHWWPDADLSVDIDQIPAFSEDREKLWNRVSAADFLSDEEKRAMLGLEPGKETL
ncbi:phage portal protein [Alterisphingorhabdus coralli]|uniref:Phage portal protein n=1 Tax=Alterisphingorhabdus coralli TaxID=3071408 RepID=A0AA97I1U8_9SPHN|nr:phage portal protein [Parasphingorhabdus sp. SCSIO 66989]WOE75675.1 phage portal protein [Parasphingorhabdus sp. SCSIO 66989]